MKKISIPATIVASIALTLTTAATAIAEDCTPKHEFTTIEPGILTVAVVSVAPIITLKDGKLGGLEGMIINKFAANECLEIKGMEIGGPGIIPSIQSKRADMATGGWYRIKSRAKIVDMSHPTMLSKMALISKDPDASYADFKGKKVGTPQGNLWVNDVQTYYGDSLRIYQSFEQVYSDLRTGRLDAGIVPFELGETWGKTLEGFVTTTPQGVPEIQASRQDAQVGFPLVKGNPDFVAALDANIREMHESGFIVEVLEANDLPAILQAKGEPTFID